MENGTDSIFQVFSNRSFRQCSFSTIVLTSCARIGGWWTVDGQRCFHVNHSGLFSLTGGVFVGGAGNRLRSFLFVNKKSLTVFCLRFLVHCEKWSLTLFNMVQSTQIITIWDIPEINRLLETARELRS
jgi:hypothetical protein